MQTDFSKPSCRFDPDEDQVKAWEQDVDGLVKKPDLDSCMAVLATIVADYSRHGVDRAQCAAIRQGLDWMQTLKARLEKANEAIGQVCVVDYSTSCGDSDGNPVPGTETDMSLIYNQSVISDDDAMALLKSGMADRDPRVIVAWPENARSVFPYLLAQDREHDERSIDDARE